jgi:pyruvate dehydrogenase E2 component (dihydrolipoamide acetyltransferase)
MAEFKMPSLGADMDAGRLMEWYVAPGDAVHRGDIVALVDTDKAAIEVEIFEDGVVGELLVEPGETVPVGTPLATVRAGPSAAEAATPAPAAAPPAAPRAGAPVVAEPPPTMAAEPRRATPAARAEARELGVDLEGVRGTGRHGVIGRADVIAASAPRARETAEPTPYVPPPEPIPPVPAPSGERSRITPRARRLAQELGVDPADVTGTGPDGTITGDDVARAGAQGAPGEAAPTATPTPTPTPTPPPAERPTAAAPPRTKPSDERYAAMRRAIAAAMAKSKREIPHYYLGHHIDMEAALSWLEERNLERPLPERILPATLLFRATALAIGEVPEMNGFFTDGRFEPREAVHMGIGISLRQGGLIAPAILDAQDKDLAGLMASVRDLVGRTRTLQLRSSEMSEATITVTALGDQGVETVYGVIYPPQVALVGFGTVVQRPFAKDGMVGARRVVHVTLSADHRASDGHTGARFLAAIDRRLQHPEEL